MHSGGILTLLSDFGLSDPYVGVMKGVIAQVNPSLTVIDLSHQIPPQDVSLARFALMSAYAYFPGGTVHVAVVDPDVGSGRRAIALAIGSDPDRPKAFFVGPDNGIFSGIFTQQSIVAAVELTNPKYWRTTMPSYTFHGRDIFAPVGAHLANGVPIWSMGTTIDPDSLGRLDIPNYIQIEHVSDRLAKLTGCVQAIDHFGNLITNISAQMIHGKTWSIVVRDLGLAGQTTYSSVDPGMLVALVGSHGWIEVAVNCGNAQERLNAGVGTPLQVMIRDELMESGEESSRLG